MSSKVKRKVTVENSKDGDQQPRRPSVFERLGPNAVNVAAQPSDRHNRPEQNEKCRNWLRSGTCMYGNTCRFKHDPFPQPSRRASKPEKDMDEKDLRHRVRTKRDEPKGSRTGSLSPKRIGKRSSSRSRKGEHESKIKSTVVVTRPRSPAPPSAETADSKKKSEGNWEDDSDDWPMDAAQLDFKEELTLERKRQQLQRELALELQKERLLNENVTITKTVSFSESSSSSSSSDSGSISSSSGSSSSSSDDDTDDSSSSSSSSSSSGSRPPVKRRGKKSSKDAEKSDAKGKDDYDKIKSSRAKMQKMRSPSPLMEGRVSKKRDKRKESPQSPKRRPQDARNLGDGRSNLNVRIRGPRTPSPITTSRKQRQWAQSSSTDSRSADVQRNRGKRHKKKRDGSKSDKRKSDRGPSPPPLSSPNRTALMPSVSSKKSKQRDESGTKSRHRGREPSPLLVSRNSASNSASLKLLGSSQRYITDEKISDKHRVEDRSKFYSRKDGDDVLQMPKRTDSRDRNGKRNRMSPRKDNRRGSLSPLKDRYDSEIMPGVKKVYSQTIHKDDKSDHRRQASDSPIRGDRRKLASEVEKKRDVRELSPRMHDSRRDNQYRVGDQHYDKRSEQKGKRVLSPDPKKGRDDRNRDYNQKDRNADYEAGSWSGDHRKTSSTGRRTPEPRGRQEIRSQPSNSQADRSRDRDQDRKKRKERDLSARSEDSDRNRLASPRRSQSPIHGHHAVREIEPLTGNRGRIYESDVPPGEREYAYGYDPLHDPYINERLLPPDYDSDVMRAPSLYPADVYPESRYRRDGKESTTLIDRYGSRDVLSPREILPHRDVISLTGRNDDYISDIPIEERGYEERWSRGRGRDDWDTYGTIPPSPLPPHVAAALDEDRYGMPRRRRASPEWQRGRIDDRDSSIGGHRQVGRGQLLQDRRSRSPPKGPGGNRGTWGDRGARHDNRNDNRHEDNQKGVDDRKGRNARKDRGKRKEDLTLDNKANLPKEKAVKRPHSPSPPAKDIKRRREDTSTPENVVLSEKALAYKRLNEELKGDNKPPVVRPKKTRMGLSIRELTKYSKIDTSSPRSDVSHNSPHPPEKAEAAKVSEGKNKDDKKPRHDNVRGDDDFSDWSDGDDDLLNRDDFVDSEGTNDNSRMRHRSGDKVQDDSGSVGQRRKDKSLKEQPSVKKIKESRSRTTSRDRSNEDVPHKDSKPVTDGKDADVHETLSLKDDTATDVDEYITAESVDYDPISDDELDALIEEPEEPITKPQTESEKSKIVDALDVDWSALMSEAKTEFKPGYARRRFTAAHVLSRIGFSQVLAGPKLSEKIIKECQRQLNEENDQNEGENSALSEGNDEKKFVMEHQIAAFHVAISQTKKERINVFNKVGPYRRALCARRDLQIRNLLCKPVNKLSPTAAVSYSPQYSVVDKDLYKQSLEFLRRKSSLGTQPQTVNVC